MRTRSFVGGSVAATAAAVEVFVELGLNGGREDDDDDGGDGQ